MEMVESGGEAEFQRFRVSFREIYANMPPLLRLGEAKDNNGRRSVIKKDSIVCDTKYLPIEPAFPR